MLVDKGEQPEKERRESDATSIDSELIGIVYEVAFDPNFWPDLLEGISNLFSDRRLPNAGTIEAPTGQTDDFEQIQLFSSRLDTGEAQRLATLLPHLYRALKLKREYNDVDHSRGQAQAIIEQFPIGVLLVNADGKLISANQHALDIIAISNTICLEADVLCVTAATQDRQLKNLIAKAANAELDEAGKYVSSLRVDEEDGTLAISLLITPDPYPSARYDRQSENCAAIFINSAAAKKKLAESALQALFDLTPAEARLTALLASGVSLNQAAEQSYISKNTAKVQLKSIFFKTGVSRQAELIKLILTSPAVFNPTETAPEHLQAASTSVAQINVEGSITLNDGRTLHYAEFGDPNGHPVIHVHGILGCRYERFPDDKLTRDLGARLIVPDRPGYGRSSDASGQGYVDFADDLLELLDHLSIKRCSIMGLSVGAIYASAFAYKWPERLHRVAMVSSTPPFRSFSDFVDVPASLKLLIAFSRYLPTAAQMIAEIAIKNACHDPGKFLANIPVCAADRAIFLRPYLMEHFQNCLLAGNKACHAGFVNDIVSSAESWPFSIADIKLNIDFWHGTEDSHAPLSRIMPVINAVPNKQFHRIEGGGHFLIYDHWRVIVESLIS